MEKQSIGFVAFFGLAMASSKQLALWFYVRFRVISGPGSVQKARGRKEEYLDVFSSCFSHVMIAQSHPLPNFSLGCMKAC
jgi:hypothetical protein